MSDLISRKLAIELLENTIAMTKKEERRRNYCVELIKAMPSAVPTPHGNLVDLDAMVDKFWDGDYMEIHCRDLDEIPVIVEAEADHK